MAHPDAEDIDYRVINTKNKWKILRVHWRYAWWGQWATRRTLLPKAFCFLLKFC